MTDLVNELVDLVDAYHQRWLTVHGDHGLECDLCAGLHERHAWVLVAIADELEGDSQLEAVA